MGVPECEKKLNAVYSGDADVRHVLLELEVPYTSLSSPLISSALRHYGVLLQCRRIGLLQDLGSEVVCWFVAHVHVTYFRFTETEQYCLVRAMLPGH